MKQYDVVIVGGGIHGAGVLQAAAAAGHSALLIERLGLASGTSSRSSKLIHGGLRYLESGQFALVRESLRERAILLRIAAELVELKPFFIPVYRETRRRPWVLKLGLWIYALLGGFDASSRFGTVPKREWPSLDGLETHGLEAVIRYQDAQTDDMLLTRAVVQSALSLGAELAMPARFTGAALADDGVTVDYSQGNSAVQCWARVLVNAAGPWAREVAGMAGVDLPVHARRRTVYVIACPAAMQPFPLMIDPSGFWIRPDGTKFIAGLSPADDLNDQPLEPDYGAFESRLWPALAHRVPAFEEARLERAWAGYFEMNTFDHNAILGPSAALDNFLFMNGFSGHGMQHSPVIGRGMAELILNDRFVTEDLSPLLFERIARNRPLLEANVIG